MKQWVKRLLLNLGYELKMVHAITFDNVSPSMNLAEVWALQSRLVNIHVNLPISKGRSGRGHSLRSDPIVRLLVRYADHGMNDKFLKAELTSIIEDKFPITLADRYNLTDKTTYASTIPGWIHIYPWQDSNVKMLEKDYLAKVKRNRRKQGNVPKKILKTINNPRELRMATYTSHVEQFKILMHSIQKEGLLAHKADNKNITGTILCKNGECVWIVGVEGNHRILAATALDISEAPIKIDDIVYFEQLASWPNVKKEIFTINEAKQIFNCVYEGLGFDAM